MSPVPTAIVADTTGYLPTELIDRYEIALVSLYVQLDGELERESEINDYAAFYQRLRESDTQVGTSQPSIGDFIATYEPLLAAGREIVSVHLSAGISGTYDAANQARQRLIDEGKGGERIHTVDSVSAAGGTAMVQLAAAKAAAAGGSAADVVARAEAARDKGKIWFSLDTLDYLRRGGRIGGAQAWIGSTLKIKPILTFAEQVEPVERVRTRKRAVARLLDYARQRHGERANGWIVQHIQDPESAGELIEACKPIFGRDPEFVSEVGPVLGAHAGPGMIGVGSVPEELFAE
ncbi:MAG: DegV family protein [Solirubrobacterales bacterium]